MEARQDNEVGTSPTHGEQPAAGEIPKTGLLSLLALSRGTTDTPNRMDILCGRGKSISAHPGNVRFRETIAARRDDYQKAKRREVKTRITEEVVAVLQNGAEPSRYVFSKTTRRREFVAKIVNMNLTNTITIFGFLYRFLLRDPNTNLFHDVGEAYARDKVSHALRSRPNHERRRQWLTLRRQKSTLKRQMTEDQERTVERLIADQQQVLRGLMGTEAPISGQDVKPQATPREIK